MMVGYADLLRGVSVGCVWGGIPEGVSTHDDGRFGSVHGPYQCVVGYQVYVV